MRHVAPDKWQAREQFSIFYLCELEFIDKIAFFEHLDVTYDFID